MVSLDWNTEILVPDTRTTSFELIVGVDITDITTNVLLYQNLRLA